MKPVSESRAFLILCIILAIFSIFVLATTAEAGGTKDPRQDQQQTQDQSVQQHQTVNAGANAENSNNQNLKIETGLEFHQGDMNIPDDITIRNTVPATAPSIDPSHPCALTVSGGIGLTGGGASFGKAYVDPECNARETSRLFYQYGEREKAIMILCEQPSAANLKGCKPYQDYNREMELLSLGHDQLVEENRVLREELEARGNQYEEAVKRCKAAMEKSCSK